MSLSPLSVRLRKGAQNDGGDDEPRGVSRLQVMLDLADERLTIDAAASFQLSAYLPLSIIASHVVLADTVSSADGAAKAQSIAATSRKRTRNGCYIARSSTLR
jgi:hypothetical protein